PATERTSPVAYPKPASSAVAASGARSRETQRLGRARRRPARTTRLFHGISSVTATATTPCASTIQRPRTDPVATAPTPVANASASATNRARFVARPEGRLITDVIARGLAFGPGAG